MPTKLSAFEGNRTGLLNFFTFPSLASLEIREIQIHTTVFRKKKPGDGGFLRRWKQRNGWFGVYSSVALPNHRITVYDQTP